MQPFFVTIICLVLFLAACRAKDAGQISETVPGDSPIPASATADGHLLRLAVPGSQIEVYQPLVATFMATYPHVLIKVESVERLTAGVDNPPRAIAAAADVFPVQYVYQDDWQSLTLDLTPYIQSGNFEINDFFTPILMEADGTIRHLPHTLYPTILVYNKRLFDEAGIAYPRSEWTWDEFLAVAQALTIRMGDEVRQYGLADSFNPYPFIGLGLTGSLIDYRSHPPRPRLTESDVVTAASVYLALHAPDGAAPPLTGEQNMLAETQSLINSERAAMWSSLYSTIDQYSHLNIGVVPFPQQGKRPYTYVNSDGFAISATAVQPEIAWQLVEFLSRQPQAGEIPARASVRQAVGYWAARDETEQQMLEAALSHSYRLPYTLARQALGRAMQAVLLEDQTVIVALTAEERELEIALGHPPEVLEPSVIVPQPETETQIRYLAAGTSTNLQLQQALAREFERLHPGWRIEFPIRDVNTLNRTKEGVIADCFQGSPIHHYNELEQVLNLQPLVELDQAVDVAGFYQVALDAFMVDGSLYALPAAVVPQIIGYNKTMFDAGGVPYPQMGWTPTEFLETAAALSQGEGETRQYGFVPSVQEYFDFFYFVDAFGLELVDLAADPPTPNFTNPAVIEMIRWYVDLSETYRIKPVFHLDFLQAADMDINQLLSRRASLLANGRGAMWITDGTERDAGIEQPTLALPDRGYVSFPRTPDGRSPMLNVSGYYISASTPHREACWAWISFLTRHDANSGVPARREVALSDTYRSRMGQEAAAVQLAELENTVSRPTNSQSLLAWADAYAWLAHGTARVIEGRLSVEAAMLETEATFVHYWRCVADNQLFGTYQFRERRACVLPIR